MTYITSKILKKNVALLIKYLSSFAYFITYVLYKSIIFRLDEFNLKQTKGYVNDEIIQLTFIHNNKELLTCNPITNYNTP